mgnify:CR=1 FL=1
MFGYAPTITCNGDPPQSSQGNTPQCLSKFFSYMKTPHYLIESKLSWGNLNLGFTFKPLMDDVVHLEKIEKTYKPMF